MAIRNIVKDTDEYNMLHKKCRPVTDFNQKLWDLLDDMADTAGTLTKACDIMVDRGARSVRAMVTHPILSGNAYQRIEDSKITELITTDSIALKNSSDKIKVLSCAPLMAEAIRTIEDNASISANYVF